MGAELLANAPPRCVNPFVQEPFLNGHQQMIRQDAQEDVCLRSVGDLSLKGFSRPITAFNVRGLKS